MANQKKELAKLFAGVAAEETAISRSRRSPAVDYLYWNSRFAGRPLTGLAKASWPNPR